ncbi:amidohydrolase family protein [Diaphorobacter sp. HDW4B]|uniref:metal-dependent hydrolase family protein n=1 Tax=Diaphorobacter sp. HDW4B TaxID=2714925 RepID=UPI00140CF8E5|nr:amidohydrolase family protein [Diaphorobacter sp. HDW4B]QIL69550.1 amidohydrolase family protein [Diaphorobacter sp. HDW4B]
MSDSAIPDASSPRLFQCICHSPAFARWCEQVDDKLSRRSFLAGTAAAGVSALWPKAASAINGEPPRGLVAFTDVQVFDGKSNALRGGLTVVVEGNKIKTVGASGAVPLTGVKVIDGGGRTLMPGLIDAHYHIMMASLPISQLLTADVGFINLAAAKEATDVLLRGFTSVRDMAGPSFSLKRAIDSGLVAGPRIWPSGAMISQTSGHGDYRQLYELPSSPGAPLSRGDAIGGGAIADGPAEVLKRAREQLMHGASQLKLAAGGGVSSNYDPIDVSQYTEAEFRAAVDAAENWGTYVTVHAYTARAIQTAIRGGVRCIEHGQLMDDSTARIMADKGIWLSMQPFLDDEDATPFPEGSLNRAKQLQMTQGTDNAYALAKKYKLKTAWGTDTLFDAKLAKRQGAQLAKMTRWYSSLEILTTATTVNAEVLAMSGQRSPYPGKLGLIEEGAYADMLLVNGDPLANIQLFADPEKNLAVVMKDGVIYKNTVG